jgi:hypothetical protein
VKIHDAIPQGSDTWHALRIGKATASEFASILSKGQGRMRASYLRRVVAETLTGKPVESRAYGSWAANLERGQEEEALARWSYELATGNVVEQVGFIEHDTLRAGCSPDSLIDGKRGLEIKCVLPTVQVETILAGGYPPEHKAQIQGSLWITGFDSWEFCSYSPDMPEHLRTYIFTVVRDEAYIRMLESEVRAFLDDVDRALERLARAGLTLEMQLHRSLVEAA